MNKIISSINFKSSEDKDKSTIKAINEQYIFKEPREAISNLSKINLMVGSNNSGKSRFIRQVYKISQLNFKLSSSYFESEIESIKLKLSFVNQVMSKYNITEMTYSLREKPVIKKELMPFLNNRIRREEIEQLIVSIDSIDLSVIEGDYMFKDLIEMAKIFIDLEELGGFYNVPKIKGEEETDLLKSFPIGAPFIGKVITSEEQKKDIISVIKNDIGNFSNSVDGINIFKNGSVQFKKVYIPILRGLLPISPGEDIYASLIRKKYFDDEDVEIFTGLNLYDEIMDMLLGDLEERELIKEFQLFLSKAFFNEQEVLIIPRRGENQVIFIKIGDEEEYPIYDLGDGLQALIILTFPLFKYKNENLLLFIEEPELNLHPGMQRKLIEILYSDVSNKAQFFMTTHSNHLLDMTLDSNNVSVYTFKKSLSEGIGRSKKSKVNVENVSSETHNPLELLGVKNSAVLLTNCTVWVEGITDRIYIRKYLEVYQEQLKESERYKEDIHYSFVEYSGNNITHWRFLEEDGMNQDTLCGKLFLISDLDGMTQDESGEWTTVKGKRHEKLEHVLQDRYKCLECREIENLLSPAILEAVICEYEKVDSLSEDYLNAPILYEEYKNELLGNYIDSKLKEKKRTGSYASSSGTVSDKTNFCKKAIAKIQKFEDLSPEAQELTETLYQFIKQHND